MLLLMQDAEMLATQTVVSFGKKNTERDLAAK
jgi:hypothetical protein